MVTRSKKRKLDLDPTKSDSEDETYDEKPQASPRKSRKKPVRSKPAKKKARKNRYGGSDDDIVSDDSESSLSEVFKVDEDVEVDERTGRPKRASTKRHISYQESDEEDEAAEADDPEEPAQEPPKIEELDDDDDEEVVPPLRTRNARNPILKLKVGPPPTARTTRAGSAARSRRGYSNEPASAGIRRSSRLHHDDPEPIVALSHSGRHAEVVRARTRSGSAESARPRRATRGGKGLAEPDVSAIVEEEPEAEGEGGAVHDQDAAHDEPDVPTSAVPRTQPSNAEKILSVEDSDPDRLQGMMEQTDASNHTHAPVDASPVDEGEAMEGVEPTEVVDLSDAPPDEDDEPIVRTRRTTRTTRQTRATMAVTTRSAAAISKKRRRSGDVSSDCDFNPEEGSDEDASSMNHSHESNAEEVEEDLPPPPSKRQRHSDIVYASAPRLRRRTAKPDYRLLRPDLIVTDELEPEPAPTPSRRGRNGGNGAWQHRSLFSTYGPFGGTMGLPPILGGPGGLAATGGVDSDSSDDERERGARLPGGPFGMTPNTAAMPSLLPPVPQALGSDPVQGPSSSPANLGRIKDRKALADADPLGVDQNINFDNVGGLQDHINQLKEMVMLPLLYPEIFQRFHVTPPRGVLFHGPPGTGKTLLARALAATVSSEGRKITFYMRKGADTLSKWVGEAERQLRQLFEEARANQPSIIFFDEIDGLAPVRSSKQEQIHASIVSTLLALMDGMDGRGQVIVIGATNRPDSIDPALRRPGRFDREFFFPLPGKDARRSILDIHTKEWQPELTSAFKDQLADLTKGYGGADLRALCTEAALNAVQRRYPQIYSSNAKLKIDPTSINVSAKDFMIAVKKIVPSSERSTTSPMAPLPKQVEPLLRKPLAEIETLVGESLPHGKKLTALEEAEFEEDADDDGGFQRERMQQDFETSRIFRPRLLIRGKPGMGQQYLAKALLNQVEGVHVQSFDLPTLLSDSTRSPEAAVVQLFSEARSRKPSIIFIPNVDSWYQTVESTVLTTFLSLLRTLAPTDPVMVLGIIESESAELDPKMLRDLFGFSKKNQYELVRPDKAARKAYFATVAEHIRKRPTDFPDPANRKKRKLEHLELAPPPPPPPPPSKEVLQAQKKRDYLVLNYLKSSIQRVMDQIKQKYRKFRNSIIDDDKIVYLYEEEEPGYVSTDVPTELRTRPYEKAVDRNGTPGLRETATGKFYYNLNTVLIEERLSNGYYKRPKDFAADIRTLVKDAQTHGLDRDRIIKAKEMLTNVEVDMTGMEMDPHLGDCENVYQREQERMRAKEERHQQHSSEAMRGGATGEVTTKAVESESAVQMASHVATMGSMSAPESMRIPGGTMNATTMPMSQPQQLASQHNSSLSNGVSAGRSNISDPHHASNGSSVPSRHGGEAVAARAESQHAVFARPSQPQHRTDQTPSNSQIRHSFAAGMTSVQREQSGISYPSGPNTQPRSQKSVLTAMQPGAAVDDYVNEASTTTSGDNKKTSDESHRSSGPLQNTPSSSGMHIDHPHFSPIESKVHHDSQLLSTQPDIPSSSQGSVPHVASQQSSHPSSGSQPPVPPFHAHPPRPSQAASIRSILNTNVGIGPSQSQSQGQGHGHGPSQSQAGQGPAPPSMMMMETGVDQQQQPEFILDPKFIDELLEDLADRTSGCSVEQMEQINTALTDSIWKQRGEWDRNKVGEELQKVFNEVIQDIEDMQRILPARIESRELGVGDVMFVERLE
ncbi:MAG: hypothetical protein M1823_005384 [Watsoniomyces obsoletus]|nr:MAG: hypothetical protein M1823_005384 [Watsoniomyces obsoletus]